jgi:hypothetical protein
MLALAIFGIGDLIPPILRYIAAKRPADHARVVRFRSGPRRQRE